MTNFICIPLLFLGAMLTGSLASCGHLHSIWDTEIANIIHDGSIGHPARIGLFTGDTLSGYFIVVRQDSTRWLEASDARMKTLPTSRIDYVQVSTPKIVTGILSGGFLGLLVGDVARLAIAPNQSGFHPWAACSEA
jgi:hypothetical protein